RRHGGDQRQERAGGAVGDEPGDGLAAERAVRHGDGHGRGFGDRDVLGLPRGRGAEAAVPSLDYGGRAELRGGDREELPGEYGAPGERPGKAAMTGSLAGHPSRDREGAVFLRGTTSRGRRPNGAHWLAGCLALLAALSAVGSGG